MSLNDWQKISGAFKVGEFSRSTTNLRDGQTFSGSYLTPLGDYTYRITKTTETSVLMCTKLTFTYGLRYKIKIKTSNPVGTISDNGLYLQRLAGNISVDDGGVQLKEPGVHTVTTTCTQKHSSYFQIQLGTSNTSIDIQILSVEEVDPLPSIKIGTKFLECTTAGNLYIPVTNMSVGTYEFDINMSDVGLFSNLYILDSPTLSSAVGYGFSAGYRNRITRYAGSDTLILQSASGVNLADTWYSLKITRTVAGVITMYIRGGAYGNNWTLVSATGGIGSNPVTDTNYFNAKIALFALRAGDKIANIKFYDGVRQ